VRFSHSQVAEVVTNPVLAAQRLLAHEKGGTRRGGYDQALRDAIYRFHKFASTEPNTLSEYLAHRLRSFKNERRKRHVLDDFADYIRWFHASGLQVLDVRIHVRLALNNEDEMSGEVSRLDLLPAGFCGVLLGRPAPDWWTEVRMPLLQRAVAEAYRLPLREVSVGVQELNGAGLACHQFSDEEVDSAVETVRVALGAIRKSGIPG